MGIKEFQAPQTKKSVAFINGDKITTLIVSMLVSVVIVLTV